MKTNTMTISSPLLFGNMTFTAEVPAQSQPKLKKDGMPKIIVQNKKRGRKSEVYPIQVSDIRRFMDWFESNKKWECYLIFVISCNLARRIGDTLSLQWKHFYDTKTGRFRKDLLEIIEDKTDKLANPHINTAVKNAIVKYLAETNVDPSENNYENYVFTQVSGNYKGRVMTADGYRKCLKKAAVALGIDYNVGTHSTRKTFGMLSRMLHAGDYDSMALLGVIYNHRDEKTTRRYTGLTKQKVDMYFDDMGNFFDDYVTGEKTYTEVAETPVVHIDVNDLRDIIKMAYAAGAENASTIDPAEHIDAINEIWAMIDGLKK